MSNQRSKKVKFGSSRFKTRDPSKNSPADDEINNDKPFEAQDQMTEQRFDSAGGLAEPNSSQTRDQAMPLPDNTVSRRKYGSSRKNKQRQDVKNAITKLEQETTEEAVEKNSDGQLTVRDGNTFHSSVEMETSSYSEGKDLTCKQLIQAENQSEESLGTAHDDTSTLYKEIDNSTVPLASEDRKQWSEHSTVLTEENAELNDTFVENRDLTLAEETNQHESETENQSHGDVSRGSNQDSFLSFRDDNSLYSSSTPHNYFEHGAFVAPNFEPFGNPLFPTSEERVSSDDSREHNDGNLGTSDTFRTAEVTFEETGKFQTCLSDGVSSDTEDTELDGNSQLFSSEQQFDEEALQGVMCKESENTMGWLEPQGRLKESDSVGESCTEVGATEMPSPEKHSQTVHNQPECVAEHAPSSVDMEQSGLTLSTVVQPTESTHNEHFLLPDVKDPKLFSHLHQSVDTENDKVAEEEVQEPLDQLYGGEVYVRSDMEDVIQEEAHANSEAYSQNTCESILTPDSVWRTEDVMSTYRDHGSDIERSVDERLGKEYAGTGTQHNVDVGNEVVAGGRKRELETEETISGVITALHKSSLDSFDIESSTGKTCWAGNLSNSNVPMAEHQQHSFSEENKHQSTDSDLLLHLQDHTVVVGKEANTSSRASNKKKMGSTRRKLRGGHDEKSTGEIIEGDISFSENKEGNEGITTESLSDLEEDEILKSTESVSQDDKAETQSEEFENKSKFSSYVEYETINNESQAMLLHREDSNQFPGIENVLHYNEEDNVKVLNQEFSPDTNTEIVQNDTQAAGGKCHLQKNSEVEEIAISLKQDMKEDDQENAQVVPEGDEVEQKFVNPVKEKQTAPDISISFEDSCDQSSPTAENETLLSDTLAVSDVSHDEYSSDVLSNIVLDVPQPNSSDKDTSDLDESHQDTLDRPESTSIKKRRKMGSTRRSLRGGHEKENTEKVQHSETVLSQVMQGDGPVKSTKNIGGDVEDKNFKDEPEKDELTTSEEFQITEFHSQPVLFHKGDDIDAQNVSYYDDKDNVISTLNTSEVLSQDSSQEKDMEFLTSDRQEAEINMEQTTEVDKMLNAGLTVADLMENTAKQDMEEEVTPESDEVEEQIVALATENQAGHEGSISFEDVCSPTLPAAQNERVLSDTLDVLNISDNEDLKDVLVNLEVPNSTPDESDTGSSQEHTLKRTEQTDGDNDMSYVKSNSSGKKKKLGSTRRNLKDRHELEDTEKVEDDKTSLVPAIQRGAVEPKCNSTFEMDDQIGNTEKISDDVDELTSDKQNVMHDNESRNSILETLDVLKQEESLTQNIESEAATEETHIEETYRTEEKEASEDFTVFDLIETKPIYDTKVKESTEAQVVFEEDEFDEQSGNPMKEDSIITDIAYMPTYSQPLSAENNNVLDEIDNSNKEDLPAHVIEQELPAYADVSEPHQHIADMMNLTAEVKPWESPTNEEIMHTFLPAYKSEVMDSSIHEEITDEGRTTRRRKMGSTRRNLQHIEGEETEVRVEEVKEVVEKIEVEEVLSVSGTDNENVSLNPVCDPKDAIKEEKGHQETAGSFGGQYHEDNKLSMADSVTLIDEKFDSAAHNSHGEDVGSYALLTQNSEVHHGGDMADVPLVPSYVDTRIEMHAPIIESNSSSLDQLLQIVPNSEEYVNTDPSIKERRRMGSSRKIRAAQKVEEMSEGLVMKKDEEELISARTKETEVEMVNSETDIGSHSQDSNVSEGADTAKSEVEESLESNTTSSRRKMGSTRRNLRGRPEGEPSDLLTPLAHLSEDPANDVQLVDTTHYLRPSDIPSQSSSALENDGLSDSTAEGRKRKMGSTRKSRHHYLHDHPAEDGGEIRGATEGSKKTLRFSSIITDTEKTEDSLSRGSVRHRDRTSPLVQLVQEKENTQRTGNSRNFNLGRSRYNVVMIGDSNVGKTSFIKSFQNGEFCSDLPPSVGIDSFEQSVPVDGKTVVLLFWDTAGQERFRSITRQVFHKAQAFVLMYDITSSESFINVRYWINCIQEGTAGDVITVLLGNKCDSTKRQVSSDDGFELAKEYNMDFMECSAVTGENVNRSLENLARMLSQKFKETEEEGMMLNKAPQQQKSSGCC